MLIYDRSQPPRAGSTAKGAHIVEQLGELRQRLFDLLDVRMAFLHFTVRGPSFAITVRVHQGLTENLTTLIVVNNSLDFLWRSIGLDCR